MIDKKSIPQEPGVYLFKDKRGEIIYVGKAKRLRSRVSSYLNKSDHSAKTQILIRNIHDIDYIVVDNEIEALLLENKLIKKHKPRYNITLKDAKTYAYIQLTDEKYPRIRSTRKPGKRGVLFGPYTDGTLRHELVKTTVRLFKLRTCKTLPKRACLNYHIGLCTAPCTGKVSQDGYLRQVEGAKRFLKGGTKQVLERLEQEMRDASEHQHYEIALEKRRQIQAIQILEEKQKVDTIKRYDQDIIALHEEDDRAVIDVLSISRGVISGKKEYRFETQDDLFESFIKAYYSTQYIPHEIIVNKKFWRVGEREALEGYFTKQKGRKVRITHPQRGEKRALALLAEKNARALAQNSVLKELQDKLNLPDVPSVIECFDMSNLGSEHLVGGMTRWVDGRPDKSGYRKFRIKSFSGKNDDYRAMREVVHRRYSRLVQEGKELPDLVIIDGGPGQLHAAQDALLTLGVKIPLISIAKKEELIHQPGEDKPRDYGKNTPMMLFLRQVRDSVHNYVVAYNRKRRQMKMRDEFKR